MKQATLVKNYLGNHELLYETWYKKSLSKELEMDYGEFTGPLLPLHELREKFGLWVRKNHENLKRIICEEWDYKAKKNDYDNEIDLIVALSSVIGGITDLRLEVACLLFLVGLDGLCMET